MPGPDTEAVLYRGDPSHGLALCDILITADGVAARNILVREYSEEGHYNGLSTIRLGHWPVFVMACRDSRLPLPPQLWFPLMMREEPLQSPAADTWQPTLGTLQAHSVYWFSRRASADLSPDRDKTIHFVSLPKWESGASD